MRCSASLESVVERRLDGVTGEAHDVLRTALALPADERAEVAAVLLESLDGEPDSAAPGFDPEWLDEIAARARRVLAGDSEGIPWEDVRRQVREQVAARLHSG